jgi:hypothetical protein
VKHDLAGRLVTATLQDILHHAYKEDGRALSALDLPMEDGVPLPEMLCSDKWAWQHTIQKRLCKSSDRFPTSAVRWALVSTAGTHSGWHIDAEGFGTMVQVQNEEGLKIWFVAVDREGRDPLGRISHIYDDWEAEKPNTDRWDVEAIALTPGMKL